MPYNFRKTTDKDVTVEILTGMQVQIEINVSLHPKDIERLHQVLDDFLPTCDTTNTFMQGIRDELGLTKPPYHKQ